MDVSRANTLLQTEGELKVTEHNLLLTQAERIRFAEYLTRDAENAEGMIMQMKGMKMPKALIEKYHTEMQACRVVAAMLLKIQDG